MIKRLLLLIAPIVFLSYTTIIVAQTSSVKTKVGNPKGGDGGWPTSGIITQGPDGAYDHGPLHLNALDIASGSSPPIYSVFDGTVTAVHDMTIDGSPGWGGYGNSVQIKNSDGVIALYGHLSVIEVSEGQSITTGTEIGIMGTTGVSTGIHLHFEVRGAPLAPPIIPEEVTPSNCDSDDGVTGIVCNPRTI